MTVATAVPTCPAEDCAPPNIFPDQSRAAASQPVLAGPAASPSADPPFAALPSWASLAAWTAAEEFAAGASSLPGKLMSLPAPSGNLQKVPNCTRANGTKRLPGGVGFGQAAGPGAGGWHACPAPAGPFRLNLRLAAALAPPCA